MGKTSDAVAEGVSIASAAARLAVRNHILVATIAHGENFDVEVVGPYAQETLIALAEEQERAADLARRQRKTAWGKFSDPDSTHDYRDRDMRNLRKRERQYAEWPRSCAARRRPRGGPRTRRAGAGCRVGRCRGEPAAAPAGRGHAGRRRPRLRHDARRADAGAAARGPAEALRAPHAGWPRGRPCRPREREVE